MGIKRNKTLYDSIAAGTGDWIALDVRYEEAPTRPIRVVCASGDTITLQGIVRDVKGIDKSFLDTLQDADISDLAVYTEDTADILEKGISADFGSFQQFRQLIDILRSNYDFESFHYYRIIHRFLSKASINYY